MKKTALLISLVVVSAVAGGSFAYGWYSVTSIPPTHEESGREASLPEPSSASSLTSEQPIQSTDQASVSNELPIQRQLANMAHADGQVRLTLDEPQLNQLVNEAIAQQPQAAQILTNAQSLQTVLKRDRIETGTIINLSELPREGLPADMQAGLEQLMAVAPMLSNRDIYVGLIAHPQIQNGKISLDQDLRLSLGQFTLPMADVADQMGFSTSDIEQRLNTIIEQQGLTLENIEIMDEKLVISGTKS